jgi:hypothetical protein
MSGKISTLQSLVLWFKSLYFSVLTPEEAEERFKNLTAEKADKLWNPDV